MGKTKVALVSVWREIVPRWVHDEMTQMDRVDFTIQECRTPEELSEFAGDADIVWIFGGGDILKRSGLNGLRNCGAIVRSGSGTDNIPVDEATEHGILVVNTPEAISDAVSDHALALLLASIRKIDTQSRAVRSGGWDPANGWPNGKLTGRTLGLIGFGGIAQLLVRKLSGYDMTVLTYDPYIASELAQEYNVQQVGLEELLRESDFVSLHCPLTPETRGMIDAERLRVMKPSALLINTARGPIVNEAALIEALQQGWIGGAALDVMEIEPPATDNPLLAMDNVIVTPHIAGFNDLEMNDFWKCSLDAIRFLAQRRFPRSFVNGSAKLRWSFAPQSEATVPENG